jgi:lipase
VVGHSFGGALAMHLAAARPDQVAGLLLLDPAVGLDGTWMHEIAEAMFSSPDYPDAAEARMEKATGSWADVDPALLDAELGEHLVKLPSGRYGWRVSLPAMMSYWSELARDIVLPPGGTVTTLVRAKWTSPPYVTDQLIAGLQERLGSDFQLLDFECNHMVPYAKPTEVATLVRKQLEGH